MIGTIFLIIAFIGGVAAVAAYYRAATGRTNLLSLARIGMYLSAVGIIAASATLLYAILQHDFSNAYVWGYSSKSLPLHFLVSTFYAGQEGSFMFWVLCSAILSFFLLRYTRGRNLEAHVMAIFLATQSFLLLLLLTKSPFRSIWDVYAGQIAPGNIPQDGRGLNPLLQNFWMVIHPPILFIGFAASAVPFSFAVAALWRKEFTTWLKSASPWILFSGLVLGLGIMLGAYWAYGVLGWGGYWGWDPVENSSLIPWIVLMALLHTAIVQKKTGQLVRTNFFLAIAAFVLVLYSTFLTRSGVLGDASVHSFTDPGAVVYTLLLAFIVVFAVVGFGMMISRRKELKLQASPMGLLTREVALTLGAAALVLIAIVVLFGTSLPIFSKATVDGAFYDTVTLPLAFAIALLIGYSLKVKWESEDGKEILKRSAASLIGAVLVAAVMMYFGLHEVMVILFVFASAFTLFVNVELAYTIAKTDPRWLGGKIAHIGLALFFLGIITSAKYGTKEQVGLELNSPKSVGSYTMTYLGNHRIEGDKYAFDVNVKRGTENFTLSPVMFQTQEQGIMRNPDIRSTFTGDLYVSPISIDESVAGGSHAGEMLTLKKGETISVGDVKAKFVKFQMGQHGMDAMMGGAGGMSVGSVLELNNGHASETIVPTAVYAKDSAPQYNAAESKLLGANVRLVSMNVDMGSKESTVTLEVLRPGAVPQQSEILNLEVNTKPFMNLLWSGSVLLFIGFIVSMIQRRKEA